MTSLKLKCCTPFRQALDFADFKEQWVVDKSCPDVQVPQARNCEGMFLSTVQSCPNYFTEFQNEFVF